MSANAFNEDTEKSLAAGMNAHISKPIEINNFYQILASKMLANPKVTGTDGSTSG
jgi:CheY-like chemotaxis protein